MIVRIKYGKYQITSDAYSAEIGVYDFRIKPKTKATDPNIFQLKYEFSDATGVKSVMKDLLSNGHHLVSFLHKIPGPYNHQWTGEVEILEGGFKKHFHKQLTSATALGSYASMNINSQPIKTSDKNAFDRVAEINSDQGIGFLPLETITVSLGSTCDCGGVKCGHPDVAGPGHAGWCKVMEKDLPA